MDEIRKFITVIDTLCEGRVAGWREEDGKPCLYDTREEAEKDANDVAEGDDPDDVIEVVVTPDRIYDPIDGRVYWAKGEQK